MNNSQDLIISQLNSLEDPLLTFADVNENDLASFSSSNFFDFDQFQSFDNNSNNNTETKLNHQLQFQQQLGQLSPPSSKISGNEVEQTIPDSTSNLDAYYSNTIVKQESGLNDAQLITTPLTLNSSSSPLSRSSQSKRTDVREMSEMDKKKRNTAASARFRIKKKLREEEMEKNLKHLTDRVNQYHSRIQQLEMENQCLKSLIVEKNEQKSDEMLKSIRERSIGRTPEYTI